MPEHPYDPDCYCLSCAYNAQQEMKSEMARSTSTRTVQVNKVRDRISLPAYIGLIHRHFQKSRPALKSEKEANLNAPVDLLDMVVPDELLDQIESIEIQYQVRS